MLQHGKFKKLVTGALGAEGKRLPVYVALGGIVLAALLAQALLSFDKQYAQQLSNRATQRVAQLVKLELSHVLALKHIGGGRNNAGAIDTWRADAASFLKDNPSYPAIALFDSGGRMRAAMPAGTESFWRETQPDRSVTKGIASPGRKMLSGRLTVVLFAPVSAGGRNEGYIGAAYDIDSVMPDILHIRDERASFAYEILDEGGQVVYSTRETERQDAPWEISGTIDLGITGLGWSVRVTLESLASQNSSLALLVFVCGAMFSLLLANALRQAGSIRGYQKRLESILDNIVDGLVTIDDHGIVQSYNKACERIFGYAPDEVIGRNVSMLMPSEHATQHDQYLENYKRTGVGKIIGIGRELQGKRRNGSLFPLELSVAEMRFGGQRSFSGIIRDISERKAAETALKRSHEELEQFAYVASHDLKAPLRGIDNLASWIAEDMAGAMTDETAEKFGRCAPASSGWKRCWTTSCAIRGRGASRTRRRTSTLGSCLNRYACRL